MCVFETWVQMFKEARDKNEPYGETLQRRAREEAEGRTWRNWSVHRPGWRSSKGAYESDKGHRRS